MNKLSFTKNPCLSTSQDNYSEVGVLMDSQSTNDTEVLIQPSAGPLVRSITME